jgi:hypothetical protein
MSHVNSGLQKAGCISLCAKAEQNEMDVIHDFIKNMGVKKARIVKTEIFEAPPQAVLTLTPVNAPSRHAPKSRTAARLAVSPSHHLRLWAEKQPHNQEGHAANHQAGFNFFYSLEAITPPKKSFKTYLHKGFEKIAALYL